MPANVIYFNESRLTPHKADLGLCVGSNAETSNDDEHDTGPSEKKTFELDSAVGKAGSFEGTSPHYFFMRSTRLHRCEVGFLSRRFLIARVHFLHDFVKVDVR